MIRYAILITALLCTLSPAGAQPGADDLFLNERLQPVKERNLFRTEGWYNWGSSIIKGPDGKYHMFYARWNKSHTFTGWLLFSEIAHAVSKTPYGPWKYKETVLRGQGPGHWDAVTAHNPKIKYFEGKYYLYYISTHPDTGTLTKQEMEKIAHTGYSHPRWMEIRNNQRTGVAVATSLEGPWQRLDHPLIEPSGPITHVTVNPAITRGPDGKYYLIVKGDKPGAKHFIRNEAIAVGESPTGPFVMQSEPVIDYIDTEDMSLWYDRQRRRFYGIFHTREGFIGLVTSVDGLHWRRATQYVLMPKVVPMADGDTLRPGRLERPFVFTDDKGIRVLTFAARKGDDAFGVCVPVTRPPHPLPRPAQLAWQNAEMGVVIHYDLHVFDGKKYSQPRNRITPIPDYNIFNPKKLDTDQWIRAVKAMGATFAILTVTHETGFALYQSEVNPYCLKAVKWRDGKGDIVRDFVNSCRKYGVKPGLYIGIRWNAFFGVHNFRVQGEGTFRENRQKYYNHMVEGMVKELCTRYGELFEIWFDGGADSPERGAPDVLPIVEQYQPHALFYHNTQRADARWGGTESGTVPYPCWSTFPYPSVDGTLYPEIPKNHYALLKHGDPDGKYWMPAMSDAPLRGYNGRHEWFWEPGDESHIFPVEKLMEMYNRSVGHNSTLILGITPDPDGLIPEPDVQRMKAFGAALRRQFNSPLERTSGTGRKLKLSFRQPVTVDKVVLQEDITQGERVRQFVIEGVSGRERKVLFEGSCIGHKLIIPLDRVQVTRLELKILRATGEPQISDFSAYSSPEGR